MQSNFPRNRFRRLILTDKTNPMNNVTLKQLAEKLNLSTSTVSRALRDSHEIGQETKDRVKALAKKLKFQPNPHASSLRQHKSNTIAVLIPEIENTFFSQVINGVELVAQSKGYHVLIYLTHEDYNKETEILRLLKNGRADGVMISVSNTTKNTKHLQSFQKDGIPLVLFDRTCDELNAPKVMTDDIEIAMIATEKLINSGCKRIAFISMSANLSISKRRVKGYRQALQKYDLQKNAVIIECGGNDAENKKKISKIFKSSTPPDGIFTATEKLAVITYEVCRENEIKLPRTFKMVSFSNLPAAALFHPPLSTIIQPAFEIGKEAASILFKLIEKKTLLPTEKRVIIPSQLVERN
ncbi:MAG: transcriptional regulator, LacI family [Chitinophagaceae bacterium]|nr:transcriptional regulator, LacI family [Chitinophagaceae bacterium]